MLGWTVLVILVLALSAPFHGSGKVIVGGAVVAALWYFLVLRGRLKNGTADPAPIERVATGGEPDA